MHSLVELIIDIKSCKLQTENKIPFDFASIYTSIKSTKNEFIQLINSWYVSEGERQIAVGEEFMNSLVELIVDVPVL